MAGQGVVILGVFVADCTFRAERPPRMGETVLGKSFALGPGGKGSNQAVAAAKAGADTRFISKIGEDAFGDMALATWQAAGVRPAVLRSAESYTGAAYIYVDDRTGDNAIIIAPGIARTISPADIESSATTIRDAAIFVTQLEQPIDAAIRALEIARAAGVTTVLNPAPAAALPDEIWPLCDYVTPNETEASEITGCAVTGPADAGAAGDALIERGVGAALITLGEAGALLHTRDGSTHIPAYNCGSVIETTGAGDAFNGGFVAALARGLAPDAAARFGSATAGLSVTRPGTAASMPDLAEIEAVLDR